MCDHNWVYEGVRFEIGDRVSGSGAHYRYYYDSYFCKKCLEHEYTSLGTVDNTYYAVRFDARPMPSGERAK